MKRLIFLLWFIIPCLAHAQDSILVRIEGRVIEQYLKTPVKFPKVEIYLRNVMDARKAEGDALGQFVFEAKIAKHIPDMQLRIDAEGRYMISRNRIAIDSTQSYQLIQRDFEISPEMISVDTWLPPDIFFKENTTDYHPYCSFNESENLIVTDSIIKEWCQDFIERRMSDHLKIELISYSDYSEPDSLSSQRLDLIYQKLISEGIPEDKLVKINKNKDERPYYKYRNGRFPYYVLEQQPLIITKALINTSENKEEQDSLKQLRRVVTFKWQYEKD